MRPGAEASRCADRSEARGEPLIGTASRYRFWLMLEQPGPWGHDALVQSDLPTDVGTRLRALGRGLRIRVLLIKRRGGGPGRSRRCFVAYTGVRERRLRTFNIRDPADVLDLDLASAVRNRFDGIGDAVASPLYLVCTHGKHDPDCARRGGPLYRSVADLPNAWECTHIGGDRFAGNLVCFPHGLYFGRVDASAGRAVASAYAQGRIDLAHYRGRSALSPPAQAAEYAVRLGHGIVGVDDLELVEHRELDVDLHRVAFSRDGTRHVVEVRVGSRAPELLTCKATEAHAVRGFAPAEVR
jgi:hypothetical protein